MNLDWFREWILENPESRVPLTMTMLGVLFTLPLVGFAVYLWRMTTRVLAERTFPPSGYLVIGKSDTVTGDAAIRRARVLQWLAVFIVVMALLLVFQLWRLAVLLAPSTFIEVS